MPPERFPIQLYTRTSNRGKQALKPALPHRAYKHHYRTPQLFIAARVSRNMRAHIGCTPLASNFRVALSRVLFPRSLALTNSLDW